MVTYQKLHVAKFRRSALTDQVYLSNCNSYNMERMKRPQHLERFLNNHKDNLVGYTKSNIEGTVDYWDSLKETLNKLAEKTLGAESRTHEK